MADVFATIICTSAAVEQARTAAAAIPGGEGMLTTGLSPDGTEPATHYIASGFMPAEIVEAMTMCDVSELPPFDAMTTAGLQLCVPSE